jgi:TetR/AcrR family transcriptional regulator
MVPSLKLCEIAATVRAKRERRKEARPGELLAAALELFVEKGYAATRVEEVAQRAGVSKGTLFLYFSSKEELFKAVVRENISGRFTEWAKDLAQFEGNSAELVRYCMYSWWERVGATQACGISKLMMSEAGNFPELASFYQTEVIQPGEDLIRSILQRGIDRGEFRPMDLTYGVYSILAPMLFLAMRKHSLGTCADSRVTLDPEKYLNSQLDTILHGLSTP